MDLYRKTGRAVTLAALVMALGMGSFAQFRLAPPERKTPRAIGVLETFKNGTRRLLPVTFFYQRHYYDAGLYRAAPVPFTLYSETVYEVQQYGKPLGTFTIQSATADTPLNDIAQKDTTAWFGNGKFKAAAEPAVAKKFEPVKVEDPTKPVLHRRAGGEGDAASGKSAAPVTPGEAEEDPDRPHLHKRTDSAGESGSTQTASASTPPSEPESSQQDPNRPRLTRHDDAGQPGAVSAKAKLTPSDDPDHPVLRRGKPVQQQGGRDLPDFKVEEPIARQVAVSDAGPSGEPAELIFICTEQERQQLEVKARELAEAELRRLAGQRGLKLADEQPVATATAKAPASRSAAARVNVKKHPAAEAKPAELPLTDEQFVPYDLDYNNYATVVYSARYAPESETAAAASAGAAPASPTAVARGRSWVVTVVARQDEDKLVKLYSAVSDPRELDLYPEVRLVDAVDPEGYGRFQLLFREKKHDGVSWLLGRATGYELQTVFETAER
jgi:hypothetical protein